MAGPRCAINPGPLAFSLPAVVAARYTTQTAVRFASRPRATSAAAPMPNKMTIGGAGTGLGSPLDVEPPVEVLLLVAPDEVLVLVEALVAPELVDVETLPLEEEDVDELPEVEVDELTLPLDDVDVDTLPLDELATLPDDDEATLPLDPPVELVVDEEKPPVVLESPPVVLERPPVDDELPPDPPLEVVDVEDRPPLDDELPPVDVDPPLVDDELPPEPPLKVDPPLVDVDPLVVDDTTTLPPPPDEPPKKPPAKKPPPIPPDEPPMTTGKPPPLPPNEPLSANAAPRGAIGGSGRAPPRDVMAVTPGRAHATCVVTTRRTRLTMRVGPARCVAMRTILRALWTLATWVRGWFVAWMAPPPTIAPPHAQAQSFAKAIFTDMTRSRNYS